jgi:predicted dinucleotide-binding enzyme
MDIAIIGKGNMGQALGAAVTNAGHRAIFGSRNAEKGTSIPAALEQGEIVLLTVPYAAALELAELPETRKALDGKVTIDVTNPLAPDLMSLTVGGTTSAAEEIALRLPGAIVIKAFNNLFADVVRARANGEEVPFTVFCAGDDLRAKNQVLLLASQMGFTAVDAGGLIMARYLEAITVLELQLAISRKMGTRIGLRLMELV